MFTSDYGTDKVDVSQYADIWTSLKGFIPAKERLVAAEHYINCLLDHGAIDVDFSLSELSGACNILDKAVTLIQREHQSVDDDDDDSDEYY